MNFKVDFSFEICGGVFKLKFTIKSSEDDVGLGSAKPCLICATLSNDLDKETTNYGLLALSCLTHNSDVKEVESYAELKLVKQLLSADQNEPKQFWKDSNIICNGRSKIYLLFYVNLQNSSVVFFFYEIKKNIQIILRYVFHKLPSKGRK